jgi:glycine cleavage system regulatory protein
MHAMKTQLLVTLVGEDKPGIVARVTAIFVDNGANLEESRLAESSRRSC